ncbi:MAG: superoxide dismutase, Ni [Pseudomonadota bacterium]
MRARAHCDVPCGIYDTGPLIYHAVSVVRLMDQYHEASDADFIKRARLVAQKEEQAEKVKHEARVIWGDYFKADQIAKHPEIHELTHSIMQTASKCKHEAHREDGERLVNLCNEFAEAFWDTKDVPTTKAPCPYPPNLAVVYPRLQG